MSLQIPALNSSDGLAVSSTVFGQEYNDSLVHQLVIRYLAGARSGTKAQKNRSAVSGGGIKPWKQKGSGRARAGTTRSPIWRTGGVTFAAKPRNYEQKLNKKMFRSGLRSILSELVRQERVVVSRDIEPNTPKTKDFLSKIKGIAASKILVIVPSISDNLWLASRNIANVEVLPADNLNPVILVGAEQVIITPEAVKQIEEHLS